MDKDNIREHNTSEGLRDDNDGRVQLRVEECIFRLAWNNKAGGYFQGIKGGVCQLYQNERNNVFGN